MTELIRTDHKIVTVIPIVQRLYAIEMLEAAGIPFKTYRRRDIPDGTLMKYDFNGKEYAYNNITAVEACVTSESLIKALEERQNNSHKSSNS